ncbi:ATP-binding protein [Neobacillus cucumis]|uniref:ATP-binding protein n=1 Tax=Neobacillus cucumis TaxID=1740721 RepID=UPI0019646D20|nr:ATP-binding protein [Neobacillus cucumis]MBM7652381.1 two-component system sporulation sensor kinase B [Neobacillus cucumis]
MIESLLLNFLFLLFPVLIYLIFFENKFHTYNKYILIFLSSISMVLCMAFPIKLQIGFIFDLRYIPFLIIALFGGYKYSFTLYFVLNIYRFMIGGPGTFQSFLFSTVIFSLVPLLSKKFIQQNAKKRIISAIVVAVLTMVFYLSTLATFLPVLNMEFWILTVNAVCTYALVMFVIMVLLEKIMNNNNARKSLLQSERLIVLSELSASVSHEIRNPLTVTNGFLQLLSKSRTITMEERTYIEYALLELKRAEKIVSDFLAFAKPQSENMVNSNLKEETEYVKNIMTPFANMHQVDIQYTFNNTLTFKYDKNQIQQCLINLLKNAVEAMKENGGILLIVVSEQKNNVMIKIEDNGIGMNKEEVLQLGSPYYSTKKEGTGLGMLMVYSTISKVNGTIQVDSEKGKGTTFTILIPV